MNQRLDRLERQVERLDRRVDRIERRLGIRQERLIIIKSLEMGLPIWRPISLYP